MTTITAQDGTGTFENKQTDTSNSGDVQAPTVEEQPPKQEEAISPRMAALARHQKMLRQQQRSFEQQRQAFEAEKHAMRAKADKADAWQQRLTQDPYSVMLEAGLTADQATALLLNQPNSSDQRVMLLEKELKELRAAQDDTSKRFSDNQNQQYEQAVNQIRNDVKILVDSDESFETIKALSAQDAVVDLIKATFEQDGTLMTNEEAAKEVEEHLLSEAMKMAQIKKVKARLAPPMEEQKEVQHQKQPMQTLSNRMVQSTAKPMSEKERKQRAILAFQGKLT